jgi:hypothetical protein
MLNQEYSYYLLRIFLSGLPSLPGLLGIIALLGAIALYYKLISPSRRLLFLWLSFSMALIMLTTAFYSAVYEFDEQPEKLAIYDPADNEGRCGTVWTNWMKGGYGMGDPCPVGCYRGFTLRKQLTMTGFPPWPEYRRQLQCAVIEE